MITEFLRIDTTSADSNRTFSGHSGELGITKEMLSIEMSSVCDSKLKAWLSMMTGFLRMEFLLFWVWRMAVVRSSIDDRKQSFCNIFVLLNSE